jgi:energy-dependent translational throttle protein EttA
MAKQFVFHMQGLSKSYGSKKVLSNINLSFYPGAKIGVVGENGSGKSTLLRIMAGADQEFEGIAEPEKGVRIGWVPQEPQLDEGKTVRENVEQGLSSIKSLLDEYDEVSAKLGEPLDDDTMQKAMDRMGVLQDKIDAVDGWEIDRMIDKAADALVLPADDIDVSKLSGGERRRVALCRALLEKPDILLLDEPTNHLDAETVEWLELQLQEYPGTVIVVTHDRYFLDNITKWILELDNGRGVPFEGNYTSWLEQKLQRMGEGETKGSARRKSLERELRWIRMSAKDREELTRERVADYERLLSREKAVSEDSTVIEIPPGPRLGEQVLSFKDVSKAYGERTLIDDLTFDIPRGAVIGVLGPNGAGKTTLFRMVEGKEDADDGMVEIGETVEMASVDQHRTDLNDDNTVWEEISGGTDEIELGSRRVNSRNYVSRFNFRGTDQQKNVGDLSGGERNRVHLAKLIRRGGNLLLLDEPTNDLDVSAMRMLEDAIDTYSGCMLIISHDRFFLDRVCSHLLVFEGGGKVRWFQGNFHQYEDMRKKELGSDVFKNRRSRYRTLSL